MVKIMENPIKMDDLEGFPPIFEGLSRLVVVVTVVTPGENQLLGRRPSLESWLRARQQSEVANYEQKKWFEFGLSYRYL